MQGGATAISETHGAWVVNCRVAGSSKVCTSSFQQFDNRNQRIFAVEIAPQDKDAVGNVALPFGLALQKGVSVLVDDKPLGEARPFSTCIPAGCLAPLAFNAAALTALGEGKVLKIRATVLDTGRDIEFSTPLSGFKSAMDRTAALLKD